MFTGLVFLESQAATPVVNAGILLSTALNVHRPCQLTVLCTWGERLKILTVSAILKVTVTTSRKERCAWDSGSVIVAVWETPTRTQAGIQCPGSLLKK